MNRILTVLASYREKESSLIFLGGVHGVGKTTICKQFFVPSGYYCITASSLIKAYGARPDKNKKVEKITDNQTMLIQQLNLEKKCQNHILLDGHYCLIDKHKRICPIEAETFRQINPLCLLLLKDFPINIASRLINRDDEKWTKDFIEQFQYSEENHAKRISCEFSIPLHIFYNGEIES